MRLDVSAGLDQQIHDGHVTVSGRPLQRRAVQLSTRMVIVNGHRMVSKHVKSLTAESDIWKKEVTVWTTTDRSMLHYNLTLGIF